ncbi:endonuclease/exonuclease/phosphatase family protein [Maribellus luteus]|uniref:Endonuclease/exonuclease/phosphatase family protein n=1 Tax=Maribellus luteus TaxID=2305463 RepID=A0A399SW54_9BACT|nr:endonuclease/exonuclease/phosphatase family protein [Maribellus luteus]RIJ46461.1 endonuclease/exonuclease/phosphatase family protein [Maribellus luteus]
MKIIYYILLVLCAISLNSSAQKEIKVMTYNMLAGLGDEANYGEGRHEKFVEWVKEQKPDVIALQELYREEKTLLKDAKTWEHKYTAKRGALGLCSNAPIEEVNKYKIEGLWHGLLHCKTYGIDFFVVHLSPASWEYRLKETRIIKNIVDSITDNSNKYILLGDFNAHSPFDCELYKQNPDLILKYKGGKANGTSKNLNGEFVDYSVMSSFYSYPLIDVTEQFVPWYKRHTFPTPILIDVWRTAGNIGRTPERIDYILTSIEMSKKCKSVKIYNVEENDYLSDHYPLEAIFSIEE